MVRSFAGVLILGTLVLPGTARAEDVVVKTPFRQAVSIPLRLMPLAQPDLERPFRVHVTGLRPRLSRLQGPHVDGVLQRPMAPNLSVITNKSILGAGQDLPGFTVRGVPPDTNGAVGATQFVEWVNTAYVIFNKSTGQVEAGPVDGNALFASLGGACTADNDGDPIVQYDKANGRWVLSQFAVSSGPPFFECVAVSHNSDATGAWNLYAYSFNSFNDYPKMGVWP
ncbi:MAG TPA: hypothetical protein VN083_05900, partial [Vicinamibacteria bacterium]|nr:hypothetical protein [Vicinamibacteria bacterium]